MPPLTGAETLHLLATLHTAASTTAQRQALLDSLANIGLKALLGQPHRLDS